jgi:hypothetical protein
MGRLKSGQRNGGETLTAVEGLPSVAVSNVLSEEMNQ